MSLTVQLIWECEQGHLSWALRPTDTDVTEGCTVHIVKQVVRFPVEVASVHNFLTLDNLLLLRLRGLA